MGRHVFLLVVLGFVGCAADALHGTRSPRPPEGCVDRRVAVGPIGGDPEWARHYAVALSGRLRHEGFTVVGDPASADVVATGHVTMEPVEEFRAFSLMRGASAGYRKGTRPVVSVEANRPAGDPLWSRHYASNKDKTLADWAEDAAEDLWKACKRQWRP